MAYQVEVTDTFGGEANYCWVRRYTIADKEFDTPRQRNRYLVREAKKLAGWTGWRCETDANGYSDITVRPRGAAMVMFIMWRDDVDTVDGEE